MKTRLFSAIILAGFLTLAFSSCDWIEYNFLNSIPFHGDPSKNPDFYVYLGIDGVSYTSGQALMQKGAFTGPEWKLAKHITVFPGTSDYSWTRMFKTKTIGGYEFEYYDPTQDKLIRTGLPGLALHILPSLADFIDFEAQYLSAFDHHANGYLYSVDVYRDTDISIADSLDNIFSLIEGRSQTGTVFSAYMNEFDAVGHMKGSEKTNDSLMLIWKKIQEFKKRHTERRYHFTLFSDHGNDFIRVPNEHLITFADELRKKGILPVSSLGEHDPENELFAIPIMHTRVTYIVLHTHPKIIEEVARRSSGVESVDLVVSKLKNPIIPIENSSNIKWYAIWCNEMLIAYFGFDSTKNVYYLPGGADYARLGVSLTIPAGQYYQTMSDAELFALTKNQVYPDLFYRIRTSLEPVGNQYPADIIVSFKKGYASLGFQLPGMDDIANAGFHGALGDWGSMGILFSEERNLPDAVREDNILDLFPRLKEHFQSNRHVDYVESDPNGHLTYQ